jgi:hypothetical protein
MTAYYLFSLINFEILGIRKRPFLEYIYKCDNEINSTFMHIKTQILLHQVLVIWVYKNSDSPPSGIGDLSL